MKKPQQHPSATSFVNQVDLIRSLEEAADFKMDNNSFKGKKMSKKEVENYVQLFSPAQQFNRSTEAKPKNRPIHRYEHPEAEVETEEFMETTCNSENWVCVFTIFFFFNKR